MVATTHPMDVRGSVLGPIRKMPGYDWEVMFRLRGDDGKIFHEVGRVTTPTGRQFVIVFLGPKRWIDPTGREHRTCRDAVVAAETVPL
jgi:hypothetical protein